MREREERGGGGEQIAQDVVSGRIHLWTHLWRRRSKKTADEWAEELARSAADRPRFRSHGRRRRGRLPLSGAHRARRCKLRGVDHRFDSNVRPAVRSVSEAAVPTVVRLPVRWPTDRRMLSSSLALLVTLRPIIEPHHYGSPRDVQVVRRIDWLGDCCRLVRVKYLLKPAATGAPSVIVVAPLIDMLLLRACETLYSPIEGLLASSRLERGYRSNAIERPGTKACAVGRSQVLPCARGSARRSSADDVLHGGFVMRRCGD
uniref:Uncharacterized protein n=1 Tax=Plectus sambesii TaxID=2011161 RepID=A0A914URD1_9BILA